MNRTVGTREWNQSVSRACQLLCTLCFFLLAQTGTAYAQGASDDTARVSPSPGAIQTPATTMPHTLQWQWEKDTLPLRKKRKSFQIPGVSLSIIGALSIITGGALVLMAADNDNQVNDYRDLWMTTTDPNELKQLKQDIRDTEDKRDLQNAFGIGTLSVGAVSLITGLILLSVMPEVPPRPVFPRQTKSTFRFRPLIGATDVGLQVIF